MKSGGKKVFLVAVLVAVAGFGTYRMGMQIFGAQQFHFSLDPKLSPAMHKAIKQAVYESYITALASLCGLVQDACPALEQISIERRANNKLYIAVTCKQPYLCIDTKVLTTAGTIVDSACFTPTALEPLPVVTQKNLFGKATITDEFKQWLLQLDPSVFASYDIVWTDDFSIQLHDKQNNQQTILCSVSTAPDKSLRELCQRIIEEKTICAQGTARKYGYTADIRFENQIIICSHKGGACHG
jgi:hypothetical protein